MTNIDFSEWNAKLEKSKASSIFSTDDFIKIIDYLDPEFQEDVSEIFQRAEPLKAHLDKYWTLTKRLAMEGDYTLSCFFALTLIEESAKPLFMFFAEGRPPQKGIRKKVARDAFQNHQEKYRAMAVYFISMNPRVDEIYGIEAKNKFETMSNSNVLVNLRHNCLLFHCKDKEVFLPEQLVTREEANLIICFCGEIYAEVQEWIGDEDEKCNRIIQEVATLRKLLDNPQINLHL